MLLIVTGSLRHESGLNGLALWTGIMPEHRALGVLGGRWNREGISGLSISRGDCIWNGAVRQYIPASQGILASFGVTALSSR